MDGDNRGDVALVMGLGLAGAALGYYMLSRQNKSVDLFPAEASPAAQAGPGVTPEKARQSAIRYATGAEGGGAGYSATNLNTDGAGLSYGILQWAQAPGALGVLVKKMQSYDPSYFRKLFGPASADLIRITNAPTESARLAPVGGVVLWREPWVSRFRQAGEHQSFMDAQDHLAMEGSYMRAAENAAKALGVNTERAVVLLFDRAVQQGAEGMPGRVRDLLSEYQVRGRPLDPKQVLTDFARVAASGFRSSTPKPNTSKFEWRQVGDEWHKFRQGIDLYANIVTRTNAILNDPSLSDGPITSPQA